MHILLGVSECYPLVKVGGLGDFAGSFAKHLARAGHTVSVVLPGYSTINRETYPCDDTGMRFSIPISDREVNARVSVHPMDDRFNIYLVENEHYFCRDHLFGTAERAYPDNAERFLFFSRALLELAEALETVDILHVNDWHAAMSLFYLNEYYRKLGRLQDVRSVLTIHNLGYQGMFWHHDMHLLNMGWDVFTPDKIEFYNHINYLKSGIVYADAITTVSPTYAMEIQTPSFGFGLDGVLRSRADRLTGILNGVDYGEWNPWRDKGLMARFSANSFEKRNANKLALQSELGLSVDADMPLITMVTRMTEQKGLDLVLPVMDMILDTGVQFAILGTGSAGQEDAFRAVEHRHQGQAVAWIGYDEGLARRFYGGGDLFLMPSRYEPCGLSQLYAMRYGNVPVVRNTGGLRDTVIDLDEGLDRATGFVFESESPYMLYETVRNAVTLFREDRGAFNRIAMNAMAQRFSWERTIKGYMACYNEIVGR